MSDSNSFRMRLDFALTQSGLSKADLVPALKAIKEDASNIITGVIAPFNRNNQEIANEAQISKITKKELLLKCILPRCIVKDNGTKIWCPSYWWDDPN